ncbi:hypothetical protein [Uliginosibacterium sp. TH139]|uniref:hypothetical protein n=1 Tax=Uliginosibacterium sp. TH139 TaxID=2067453 RepID=UPI000C7ADA49|nr:hypothetical protein [Uliginosibacterium sp. TH139]PLK47389.1 hypothetical protein C0V76_17185 [Uliginosibacterium sp. TH139]
MSEACEDFLRGQGRLAGLLWELPPYEPPASLEARFLAAARAAQASAGAASGRSSANQIPPAAFEAPPQMAARFGQLAATLEAAQAPRREAVLTQIAQGEAPQDVLGAPIQPATAAWLQAQAASKAPVRAAKPARKPVLWGFSWFDLRLAALATVLAAVSTQWLQQHAPSSVELALLEAFQRTRQPLAEAQPDQPQNPLSAARAKSIRPPAALPAAPPPPAPELAREEIGPPAHLVTPIELANPSTAESIHAQQAENRAAAPVISSEQLREHSPLADAQPAPLMAARKAAPPAPRLEEASPPPPALAAAEKQLAEPKPMASRSAPLVAAPPPAKPAAPMPAASPSTSSAGPARIEASLQDDPALIAARLPTRPASHSWLVFSATPAAPEVQAWLSKLRAALSASPALFEPRLDPRLPPGQLRIVVPAEAP